MASNSNDDLVVKIRADIKALQAGLRQAAKEADIAGKTMQAKLEFPMSKIKLAMAAGAAAATTAVLGIATAGAAAGVVLSELLDRALETADGLQKLTDKTGISVEELQRLRYAAGQVGLGVDELDISLEKFTKVIGAAQSGSVSARTAFKNLHVDLSDQSGPRSAEEVFLDVIRVLEDMPDAAARAAAANEIFGKSGVKLALLASQGAGGLDELRGAANRLGLVIGKDLVSGGDNAGDALDRLKSVIAAGLNKALLAAAPEIEKFVDELLADPEGLQRRIADLVEAAKAIAGAGVSAGKAFVFVADFISGLKSAAESYLRYKGIIQSSPLDVDIGAAEEKLLQLESHVWEIKRGVRAGEQFVLGTDLAQKELDDTASKIEAIKSQIAALKGQRIDDIFGKPGPVEQPIEEVIVTARKKRRPATPDEIAEARKEALAVASARESAAQASDQRIAAEMQRSTQSLTSADLAQWQAYYDSKLKLDLAAIDREIEAKQKAKTGAELPQQIELDGQIAALRIQRVAAEEQAQADIIAAEQAAYAARSQMAADYAASQAEALEALRTATGGQLDDELAQEQKRYDALRVQLGQANEDDLELRGGYYALSEQLEAEHQQNIYEIRRQGLQSNLDLLKYVNNDSLRSSADMFASALAAASTYSKKAFKIQRDLAIANTIVKTYEGVQQAFSDPSLPFYAKFAAAASALAFGLANVQAISKAKFGGGGASGSLAGAGNPNNTTQPAGGGSGSGGQAISVTLVGDNFSAAQVRDLIEQIKQARADGADIG